MFCYEINKFSFQYPMREQKALEGIHLQIAKGEFVVLFGLSGCGKSTLLRQLKTILTPHGEQSGEILFEGRALSDIDFREQSQRIGYVTQNPDNQIVTDKVWHELAFGLESLGLKTEEIRLRVAEMASFFGIQSWFHKKVEELSGGQKQILNLASILVMQPSVLILDEPTAQLDPIASAEFFETLKKINDELGVTVILSEQRLEEVLPLADRVILLQDGKVILNECDIYKVAPKLKKSKHPMFYALPTPARVYTQVESGEKSPMTVKEGKMWLEDFAHQNGLKKVPKPSFHHIEKEVILELDEIFYKYEKDLPDVAKGVTTKIYRGEFYAIVGGNGTGKTTTLSLMSGLRTPYRGKIFLQGKELRNIPLKERFDHLIGILPQNPQTLFVKKTVAEDLEEVLSNLSTVEKDCRIAEVATLCDLTSLLRYHPYDLSGGEQQRVALAKVLLLQPSILFLDEPTKGLDGYFKRKLAMLLKKLQSEGVTIVMVSHDVEFCAMYVDRCAMFFDGNIVSENEPRKFFAGNTYYTTASNRMARDILPEAVLEEDIIRACGGENIAHFEQFSDGNSNKSDDDPFSKNNEEMTVNRNDPSNKESDPVFNLDLNEKKTQKIVSDRQIARQKWNRKRLVKSLIGLTALVLTIIFFLNRFKDFRQYLIESLIALEFFVFLSGVFPGGEVDLEEHLVQESVETRHLTQRTLAATAIILILIPLTIYIGIYYLEDRKYYFISMLIILETFIPFMMIFEKRKPQAKELVIISVLCAIAVAGRSAFFMIPQFKPVAAITIITGACLGAEAGFLTGAVSMFVSNMFAGQGPWTPWQMFAMGIIGFLAGILYKKGWLRKMRGSLCVFGGIVVFFVYGGLMNPASVLMFQPQPTKEMFFLAYIQGIPFDLIHAFATAFFLWFFSKPMIEKLERVKIKYGILK